MVSWRPIIWLAAVTVALPARAEPDWTLAGGGLFVGAPPLPIAGPRETDPVRLEAPDQPLDAAVSAAAVRHGLDPKLLHALIVVESGYRIDAVSPAGAQGLTQLMPATAAALGVRDPLDSTTNLAGGAAFLVRQIVRFGDLRLALAAYNAGPERVSRLGRIPRIAETQAYVEAVVECYLALSAGRAVRSAADCRRGSR